MTGVQTCALPICFPVTIEYNLKQVKRVETGRQKFVIEDVEIWAMSQEEAQKAFDATFK